MEEQKADFAAKDGRPHLQKVLLKATKERAESPSGLQNCQEDAQMSKPIKRRKKVSPSEVSPPQVRRDVLRDKEGVIVGTQASQGPKILGHVDLSKLSRPAARSGQQLGKAGTSGGRSGLGSKKSASGKVEVVMNDKSSKNETGRVTSRKRREEKALWRPKRVNKGRKGKVGSNTVEKKDEKKRVRINESISVTELAHQLGVKAPKVIRVLWSMGQRKMTMTSALDVETTELIAAEFGYRVEDTSFREDEAVGSPSATEENEGSARPPIIAVMGHVDHGKTTLLDSIRKAKVADGEAGGITQHVAAYEVEVPAGRIIILDTPGHQAFSAMRMRGAALTDLVVLVVAADDGLMPTSIEVIKQCGELHVPILVAINKMDKPEANPMRVKQMLMEHQILGEEFGGQTCIVEISAKTGDGLDALLEHIVLQAEVLDLRTTEEGRAQGTILESRVEKGRGNMATVMVQRGTLKKGDVVVAGELYGKVRGITVGGSNVKEALPPSCVELLGFEEAPSPGLEFSVVESERVAKQVIGHRRDRKRKEQTSSDSALSMFERMKRGSRPKLRALLRSDVQGSNEALKQAIEELATDKVEAEVVLSGVGKITEKDLKYAAASDAVIFAFGIRTQGQIKNQAKTLGVNIYESQIIYEAIDCARELMIDKLEPICREKSLGMAEVRQIFPSNAGNVCGCRVLRGSVSRNAHLRVTREGETIHDGQILSLRVFKEDVSEVKKDQECGIVVDFGDIEVGDHLEIIEIEKIRPTL